MVSVVARKLATRDLKATRRHRSVKLSGVGER